MASAAVASAGGLPPGSILLGTGILVKDSATTTCENYPFQPLGYRLDLAKLETFFQSVNKQLFETQVQVQGCVAEKTYKTEIAQRLELTRKVDSSVMDINMIKDMIYADGQQMMSTLRENKVQLLRGEVENLKMIIRRMEMQQAESLEVFGRLKKIEKQQIQFEDDFIQYKNSDLFGSIREEVNVIKDEMVKQVGQERKDINRQFLVLETKLHQLETTTKSVALMERFNQLEEKIQAVETKTDEVEKTLTEALEGEDLDDDEDDNNNEEGGTGEDAVTDDLRPRFLNTRHKAVENKVNHSSNSNAEEAVVLSEDSKSEEEEEGEAEDVLPPLPVCAEEEEVAPAAAGRAPRNSMIQMPSKVVHSGYPKVIGSIREGGGGGASFAPYSGPPTAASSSNLGTASTGFGGPTGGGRQNRAVSVMLGNKATTSNTISNSINISNSPSSPSMMMGAHPDMMMRKKSSRKFSILGGGGASLDSLKEKFLDIPTFKLWQQEVLHLRKDIGKIHLKFHAMEGTSVIRIFRKYTVVKERQAIQSAFLKFQLNVLHRKKAAQVETDQMMKVFQNRILRFSDKRRLVLGFHRWAYASYMVSLGEHYRPWIKNKIQLWMDSTHPKLGEYMNRWKKFTLFSIRAMMLKSSNKGHSMEEEEGDEMDENLLPSTMVLNSMNNGPSNGSNVAAYTLDSLKKLAHLDLKAKWKHQERRAKDKEKHELLLRYMQKQLDSYRIQQQVEESARNEKIYDKLQQVEGLFQKARQDVNKSIVTLDEQKSQLQVQTETQINALLQQLTMYKSQVTLKFSYMKEELDEEMQALQTRLSTDRSELQDILDHHKHITTQLQAQQDWQTQMTNVIIPDVSAQFTHLEQTLSTLQSRQDKHAQDVQDLQSVQLRLQEDMLPQLIQVQTRFDDMQHFYDEELLWLKTIMKQHVQGVNEFKARYDSFAKEMDHTLEGILNEDSSGQAQDSFLQPQQPLPRRMQKMIADLKQTFVRYETWFMLFHDSSASHLLTAMLFPQQQQQQQPLQMPTAQQDMLKVQKWNEHQRVMAIELSMITRKLAQQIATKCDYDLLSAHIRQSMLRILPQQASSGTLQDTAAAADRTLLQLRSHYLQSLTTILKEQLNHFEAHEISVFHRSHHHMGIEFVKRKQRFVEQFVHMVEAALSSFPVINQFSGQHSSLSTSNVKGNLDTQQLSNNMVDYMNCMACNRPMSATALRSSSSPAKQRTAATQSRRPVSATATGTTSRYHHHNNNSNNNNNNNNNIPLMHSTSQPFFNSHTIPTANIGYTLSEDAHPLDLGEYGIETNHSQGKATKISSSRSRYGADDAEFMISTSASNDFYASMTSKGAEHDFTDSLVNVSKADNLSYPTHAASTDAENHNNVICAASPHGKKELHITLATPKKKTEAPSIAYLDAIPSYQPSPLPAPRLTLDVEPLPQFSRSSFPSEFVPFTSEMDNAMKLDQPASQPIPFALSAALENIQNGTLSPEQYMHYSEKKTDMSRSHSSTFADSFVVSHSAVQQQMLVDSLAQLHPKDISIRPKHEDVAYEQLTSSDVGIESRKLYGTKQ